MERSEEDASVAARLGGAPKIPRHGPHEEPDEEKSNIAAASELPPNGRNIRRPCPHVALAPLPIKTFPTELRSFLVLDATH